MFFTKAALAAALLFGGAQYDQSGIYADSETLTTEGGVFTGALCLNDNVELQLGSACGDSALYYNGSHTIWLLQDVGNTGSLMLALGDNPPAPDNGVFHIWNGTVAGSCSGSDMLCIESAGNAYAHFLAGNAGFGGLLFGDAASSTQASILLGMSSNGTDPGQIRIAVDGNTRVLDIGVGLMEHKQATTYTTTAGNLTLGPAGAVVVSSAMHLAEIVTPGTIADHGAIYPKANNNLYFKDADGVEHAVSLGGAYSSLWYHGVAATTTISAQDTLTKITTFDNVGPEDVDGGVIGDATTDDDLTIGASAAGVYSIAIEVSLTNGGAAARHFKFAPCIILNTPKTITNATNATPIVVTSAGHGLLNGDMITISGVGGNTAANGDFVVSNKAPDTFELHDLDHVDVAGSGAYTTGGTVDKVCPGEIVIDRVVSNVTLGRGAAHGKYRLYASDVVEAYVANVDSTDDAANTQISISVEKTSN